jgi:hypothetical protein
MGCAGAPIIEVLRCAGPFDGFRRLPGNALKLPDRTASELRAAPPSPDTIERYVHSDSLPIFTAIPRTSPGSGHRDGTESVCRLRWTAAA